MASKTAGNARVIDLQGAKYQRQAFEALPLLIRQAHSGQTIYYGDLGAEMSMRARNLNWVLGSVGNSLLALSAIWKEVIPPLQALVINREEELPGSGFIHEIVDPLVLAGASKRTRKQVVDAMLAQVYSYPRWDAVLAHFGAKPVARLTAKRLVREAAALGDGGESAFHRALKEFIAKHPESVGVLGKVLETTIEYRLSSGDEIDVFFRLRGSCVAVEVKSDISPEADLARGVFQCVKYEAVLNAMARYEGVSDDVSVCLALSAASTPESHRLANILGISIVEGVGPSIPVAAV